MKATPGHVLHDMPATVLRVLRLLWAASPTATAVVLGLQIASAALTAFGLLATAGVLTSLLAARPTSERVTAALPALILVGGAYVLRGLADAGIGEARARLVPNVHRVTEDRLYATSARVELAAFEDADWYEAMCRARDRGVLYTEMAADQLLSLTSSLVGLGAVGSVLGVLHPVLVPLLAISVLPQGWAALSSARYAYAAMFRWAALCRRQGIVAELLSARASAAEIRTCTAQDFLLGEYRRFATAAQAEHQRIEVVRTRRALVGRALSGVGTLLTYLVLGLLLRFDAVPLAAAGAAVLAIHTGQAALGKLAITANKLYEDGLYIGDYQNFIAAAEARCPPTGGSAAPRDFSRITLERVSFRYPGAEATALDDISLTLRRGEVIALVGENGSGKTTLAKLLAGLYQPESGTIRWDATDLTAVDVTTVHDQIALVSQEVVRWPMTARENIIIGRHDGQDPHDGALRAAADTAGATSLIEALPAGYDTMLSRYIHGGVDLSGGQWQTMAIARALYRDAALLICDEPTAFLDPRAEHRAYQAIRRLATLSRAALPQGGHLAAPSRGSGSEPSGNCVVLITHRLASVREADRIYVLERGRLVEEGSHDELMRRGGTYADLYSLQAAGYQEPENGRRTQIRAADQPSDRGAGLVSRPSACPRNTVTRRSDVPSLR